MAKPKLKPGFVAVKNSVTGAETQVSEKSLPVWAEKGWEQIPVEESSLGLAEAVPINEEQRLAAESLSKSKAKE